MVEVTEQYRKKILISGKIIIGRADTARYVIQRMPATKKNRTCSEHFTYYGFRVVSILED